VSVGRRLVDGLRKRRRFWESVPRRGHLLILVAVFSIFSAFGFLADMMSLGRLAPTDVVMMAALSGIIAALLALTMIRHAAFHSGCRPARVHELDGDAAWHVTAGARCASADERPYAQRLARRHSGADDRLYVFPRVYRR
jgi:hypothetical protein